MSLIEKWRKENYGLELTIDSIRQDLEKLFDSRIKIFNQPNPKHLKIYPERINVEPQLIADICKEYVKGELEFIKKEILGEK